MARAEVRAAYSLKDLGMSLKLSEPQVPQLYREDAHRKYWTHRCSCSWRGTYFGMCMNFAQ